jgi:hypothetical protein
MGWDPNPVYRRALLMQIENVTRPRLFSALEAAKKKLRRGTFVFDRLEQDAGGCSAAVGFFSVLSI